MTRRLGLRPLGLLVVLGLLGTACDKAPTASPDPAAASAAPRAAPPKVDSYRMSVDNWEGPKGEEGYVVVTIEARNGHKINKDYPHKVSLEAPPKGLTLPLRTMTREHAEMSGDKQLVFSIPAVASTEGEYALNGTVKLSVCNADACRIEKEQLSARVVAQ